MFKLCNSFSLIAAIVAAASTPAFAQDEEIVLSGASPWNLDFAEDSCGLRRMFSDGTRSAFLEMRQFAPGLGIRFMVYSNEMEEDVERVRYVLYPDGKPQDASGAFSITLDDGGEGAIFNGRLVHLDYPDDLDEDEIAALPEPTPEEIAAIENATTGLTLLSVFDDPVRLDTGSLGPPMEAMRLCLNELMTHWGIDVEAHQTLSRRVEPYRQERWVRSVIGNYPRSALVRGEQAAIHIRVIVNEEGRADSCVMQAGLGSDAFEEAACRELTRNARFLPALDAQGTPITSYWTTSIFYVIN